IGVNVLAFALPPFAWRIQTQYGVTQGDAGKDTEGRGFCVDFRGLSGLMLPLYGDTHDGFQLFQYWLEQYIPLFIAPEKYVQASVGASIVSLICLSRYITRHMGVW
ncbi:hypothetical protein T310_7777, partial [Rasamsonia emersonii CBS 393.64]